MPFWGLVLVGLPDLLLKTMTNPFYVDPTMFSRLKPPLVGEDETNPDPSQYDLNGIPGEVISHTSPGHPLVGAAEQGQGPSKSLGGKKKFDKSDFFLNLLSNFTYALGQGLQANNGNGARGDMQGAGAALVAPFQLKRIKQQDEYQRQQMERAQAQEELYRQQALRQMQLHEENNQRIAEGEKVRTAAMARLQVQVDANAPGKAAQANRAKYISTNDGVMEITDNGLKRVEGTGPTTIEVTSDIATRMGLPEDMIGKKLKASEINQLGAATERPEVIVKTSEGVILLNKMTGVREKLGNLPPSTSPGQIITTVDSGGTISQVARVTPDNRVIPIRGFEGERKTAKSAELRKLESNAKRGLRVIPQIRKLVASAPNKLILVSIPGSIGARDLRALKDEATDAYIRINTGAALNEDEQTFYDRYGGTVLDVTDIESFKLRLRLMEETMNDMANTDTNLFGPTIESVEKSTGKKVLVKQNKKTGKWIRVGE